MTLYPSPVPDPVTVTITTVLHEGTELGGEQHARVKAWLEANGIDPAVVPLYKELTIRTPSNSGGYIHYWCYFINADGAKEVDAVTGKAVIFPRTALLTVPLDPEPTGAGERQSCPRRIEDGRQDGQDAWTTGHGLIGQSAIGPSCSYCGSLHPDRFMELVREGWTVGPTDKSYKAYLQAPADADRPGRQAKFYFQHLSQEQQQEFIDLINAKRMRIGEPGHFYVLPFFCGRRSEAEAGS